MTIDVDQVAGRPAAPPMAYPVTVGWTQAVMAINSNVDGRFNLFLVTTA